MSTIDEPKELYTLVPIVLKAVAIGKNFKHERVITLLSDEPMWDIQLIIRAKKGFEDFKKNKQYRIRILEEPE